MIQNILGYQLYTFVVTKIQGHHGSSHNFKYQIHFKMNCISLKLFIKPLNVITQMSDGI